MQGVTKRENKVDELKPGQEKKPKVYEGRKCREGRERKGNNGVSKPEKKGGFRSGTGGKK